MVGFLDEKNGDADDEGVVFSPTSRAKASPPLKKNSRIPPPSKFPPPTYILPVQISDSSSRLYPQENNPPQGWGLSFMLTQEPGATGRGRNTAWWAGIANLFWWCDREKGVAGMIASQVMPFGDMNVMGQWGACEAAVYQALEGQGGKEGGGEEKGKELPVR
jgi:hypothetical protein